MSLLEKMYDTKTNKKARTSEADHINLKLRLGGVWDFGFGFFFRGRFLVCRQRWRPEIADLPDGVLKLQPEILKSKEIAERGTVGREFYAGNPLQEVKQQVGGQRAFGFGL